MKLTFLLFIFVSITCKISSQIFTRAELPTDLTTPWEIVYGPDGYLWITEESGVVSRVHPETGAKQEVYAAPDFFVGSQEEQLQLCFMPQIGQGTLGLDLHPDFMNESNPYIYYIYSYNAGTAEEPATRFKLARLTWDWKSETVTQKVDLVTNMSNGYDHWGGRVMAINRTGTPYLFLSIGDHGISEINSPDCYDPQSLNPNNQAQNPDTDNGKIHRYNLDGSIPADNPIPGNSFYTRGHRNPQGLMYIPQLDMLFDVEHGDRTDDEINLLEKGMNYGWKWVRGYHNDDNYPGEAEFIANYVPDPRIAGDRLVEAFYSFCSEPQPISDEYLEWCTPAPSDGIYYNATGIPEWTNSLLVVSLKNGSVTDNEVHVFKLTAGGQLATPDPVTYFAEDQALNGRLRDITFSPDGKKIFLINNGGENIPDKITVYTVQSTSTEGELKNVNVRLSPNPVADVLSITSDNPVLQVGIYSLTGQLIQLENNPPSFLDLSALTNGLYVVKLQLEDGRKISRRITKI